jgi:hypothetical protein
MDIQTAENRTNLDFIVSGIIPPPTVTLTSSSNWVAPYESVTLTWTSTGADYITLEMVTSELLPPNGSRTFTLQSTSTIWASAYNRGGSTNASVKVYVASTSPPTAKISANPTTLLQGNSFTLTWTTERASTIIIDNGIGTVAASGNRIISPTTTTTYKIIAMHSNGYQVAASVMVEVIPVPLPTIILTATPEMLAPGGNSTLKWTSTNATSVVIDNNIGSVDMSGIRIVSPTKETTYSAIATGPGGIATTTVTVKMLGTHLLTIWNEMKAAMIAGDINQLKMNFSDQTRDKYLTIFDVISDQLPQIAQEMREIEPVYFEEFGAKFRIKRTEEINGISFDITYYVYFVQEEDDSWKILNY